MNTVHICSAMNICNIEYERKGGVAVIETEEEYAAMQVFVEKQKEHGVDILGLGSNTGLGSFVGWVNLSFVGFRSSSQPTCQPFWCYQ